MSVLVVSGANSRRGWLNAVLECMQLTNKRPLIKKSTEKKIQTEGVKRCLIKHTALSKQRKIILIGTLIRHPGEKCALPKSPRAADKNLDLVLQARRALLRKLVSAGNTSKVASDSLSPIRLKTLLCELQSGRFGRETRKGRKPRTGSNASRWRRER